MLDLVYPKCIINNYCPAFAQIVSLRLSDVVVTQIYSNTRIDEEINKYLNQQQDDKNKDKNNFIKNRIKMFYKNQMSIFYLKVNNIFWVVLLISIHFGCHRYWCHRLNHIRRRSYNITKKR